MTSITFDFAACLGCYDVSPERRCSVLLPRQSPLGTTVDQRYQPTDEWPASFLCLRHGHTSVRSVDSIQLEAEMLGQEGRPLLWRIVCRCGHENCGRLHVFYVHRMPDWPTITRLIMKINPSVPCGDGSHSLVWRENSMEGTAPQRRRLRRQPVVGSVYLFPRG
jgi:hypothetical protein